MREPNCPDCRQRMEDGFLVDFGHGAVTQTAWQPGAPVPRKFLGMNLGSVKVNKTELKPVRSLRCSRCGLLRNYAE